MSNISRVRKAMDTLAISYTTSLDVLDMITFFDKQGTMQYFHGGGGSMLTSSFASIFQDKRCTYIYTKKFITTPKTRLYKDPACKKPSRIYKDSVLVDILKEVQYPCIIKPVKGSLAKNVQICYSEEECHIACKKIFGDKKKYYPYLLFQSYIDIVDEYRVILWNDQIQFVYKKVLHTKDISTKYTIYQTNTTPILVTDTTIIDTLQAYLSTLSAHLPLSYGGLDIALDSKRELHLIEINSKPQFNEYVRHCGEEQVVAMYTNILSTYENSNA